MINEKCNAEFLRGELVRFDSKWLSGEGVVVREYTMPPNAPAASYGFWSHPGTRIYVVGYRGIGGHQEIAFSASDLTLV